LSGLHWLSAVVFAGLLNRVSSASCFPRRCGWSSGLETSRGPLPGRRTNLRRPIRLPGRHLHPTSGGSAPFSCELCHGWVVRSLSASPGLFHPGFPGVVDRQLCCSAALFACHGLAGRWPGTATCPWWIDRTNRNRQRLHGRAHHLGHGSRRMSLGHFDCPQPAQSPSMGYDPRPCLNGLSPFLVASALVVFCDQPFWPHLGREPSSAPAA